MKTKLLILALIMGVLLLAGCEKDDYNNNGQHRDSPAGNGGIITDTTENC